MLPYQGPCSYVQTLSKINCAPVLCTCTAPQPELMVILAGAEEEQWQTEANVFSKLRQKIRSMCSSSRAPYICNNIILLLGGLVYFLALKKLTKADEQNKLFRKSRLAEAQSSEDDSQDWMLVFVNSVSPLLVSFIFQFFHCWISVEQRKI